MRKAVEVFSTAYSLDKLRFIIEINQNLHYYF